jgi:uncharacterized protein YkwD
MPKQTRAVRPLLLAALAAGVALAGCASTPPAQAPAAESPTRAPRVETAHLESSLLEAANAARAEVGVQPLAPDSALAALARAHSADMARRRFFAHATPEGTLPTHRAREAGYAYRRLGENLYRGAIYSRASYIRREDRSTYRYEWRTPEEVAQAAVTAWLESPPHRETLLAAHFTHADFGVAIRDLDVYVTLNLSEPRTPPRWREVTASRPQPAGAQPDRAQPTSAEPMATRRSASP